MNILFENENYSINVNIFINLPNIMKYIYKLTISFGLHPLTIGCRPKDSLGPGPENLSKFETSQDSLSKIFHIAYQNIIKMKIINMQTAS